MQHAEMAQACLHRWLTPPAENSTAHLLKRTGAWSKGLKMIRLAGQAEQGFGITTVLHVRALAQEVPCCCQLVLCPCCAGMLWAEMTNWPCRWLADSCGGACWGCRRTLVSWCCVPVVQACFGQKRQIGHAGEWQTAAGAHAGIVDVGGLPVRRCELICLQHSSALGARDRWVLGIAGCS